MAFVGHAAKYESEHSAKYRCQEELEHVYIVEESIYRLAIIKPYKVQTCVLVTKLFFIVGSVSVILSQNVVNVYNDVKQDTRSICKYDGTKWDCRPPGYESLFDFSVLDQNNDGNWSVAEARGASRLQQFRAIHDVILSEDDVLRAVMPAKAPKLNVPCYLFEANWGVLLYLKNVSDLLTYFDNVGQVPEGVRS